MCSRRAAGKWWETSLNGEPGCSVGWAETQPFGPGEKCGALVIEMTLLDLRGSRLAEECRVFLEQDRAASFFQGGRGRSHEFDRREPEKLGFEFRARLVTAGFREGANVGTRRAKVEVW